MTKPRLEIDKQKRLFLIAGDVQTILDNRRARYYFQDVLNADLKENDGIAVPYGEDERRDLILNAIHEALEKYGIEATNSDEIETVFKAYFSDRQNFAAFSRQAREIWNNVVDASEFQRFVKAIDSRFPEEGVNYFV